jgi:hypothetical protein
MTKTKKRTFSLGDEPVGTVGDQLNKKPRKTKAQANVVSASQPVSMSSNDMGQGHDNASLLELQELRRTVTMLEQRVDFLLSFLGIVSPFDDGGDGGNVDGSMPPVGADDRSWASVAVGSAPTVRNDVSASRRPVVRGPDPKTVNPVLSNPMRQAVISAVYSDLQSQARRAANIVVTGLTPDVSTTDEVAIRNLIQNEFHCQPSIAKCRRLGKVNPGKIQPLLVTFNSEVQADHIISKARMLRQSSNEAFRHVYINKDMTRAQATAEYHTRCRRRADRASRAANRPTEVPSGAAALEVRAGRQSVAPAIPSTSDGQPTTPTLSADARPFVATAVGEPSSSRQVDSVDPDTVPSGSGRE